MPSAYIYIPLDAVSVSTAAVSAYHTWPGNGAPHQSYQLFWASASTPAASAAATLYGTNVPDADETTDADWTELGDVALEAANGDDSASPTAKPIIGAVFLKYKAKYVHTGGAGVTYTGHVVQEYRKPW